MVKKMKKIIIGLFLVMCLFLSACEVIPSQPSTQKIEQTKVENNQQTLIQNQPVPQITKSLERENIINRLNLLNDESKVFYVYLVSYGKVMAFYTAKGKVTSLNSYINSQQRVVNDENCNNAYGGEGSSKRECYFVIDTPDIDGSYGENADGVFFFTTEGAYVEWVGEYMVSDFPLKLTQPAELVKEVK
jgi:hypothetical protein